jgi:hypothetical protein
MIYGCLYQKYQNISCHFFVDYIIVPCIILSSFFVLFKFSIGINSKLLTLKTKICKICNSRYHGGSFYGTPQPPAALCNPQQPHWLLEAPRSIPQPSSPPMAYCICLELTQKKEWLGVELAQKKHSLKVHDANHYTTAPGTL